MDTTYADMIDADGLLEGTEERTSDIPFPAAMNLLLLIVWLIICVVGFGVIFLARNALVGVAIIAAPTFVGMVLKPTFALCLLMMILPTGAGVGYGGVFSLDRGVGVAVAAGFLVNVLLTRPGLRIRHKALWVAVTLCLWIGITSLAQPYLKMEVMRAFTQFQLLALFFIVYWILETNDEGTFRWALRSYVLGMIGTIVLAIKTGAAIRAVQETRNPRFSATLGHAIDANMLAALASLAFLSAIYLFARDRSLCWRAIYLVAMLFLPVMMLRIGSRGGLVALAFTMLSPLLFVRQVVRRPALAASLLLAIVLASASAGLLVKQQGLATSVFDRLTNVQRAQQAVEFRMEAVKHAWNAALLWPAGTGYYSWFERTGSPIWPHNDFFFSLGVYGIPAAILFTAFVILLTLTVKRTPLTLEKLYARAVLTYLLVMGLNIKQLSAKYYWAFLGFVLAAERLGWWHSEPERETMEEMDADAPDTGG
ncbi:MAG: hypothetical protein JW955_21245 [Sedimentisphaerales bacterium]|nr:hypothetical protein [Sedimentisphaerales bacterium]